jgi:hypothetical protein
MNARERRLMWFVGIYLGSVSALAAITILIRGILRLLIVK